MRFSDGIEFDTTGPLRLVRRHDGRYVVGKGMLVPVDSYEDGQELICQLNMREHKTR
jgi:hypothetical protein